MLYLHPYKKLCHNSIVMVKNTNTEERDEVLFRYYVSLLKSHGEYAKYVLKKDLYEEVGRIFFISPRRVQGVIADMLKKKERIKTTEEAQEDLDIILSLHGQKE